MVKQKIVWVCTDCGNKQFKWTGSCNICKNWNTLVEELEAPKNEGRFEAKTPRTTKPVLIEEVDTANFNRVKTNYQELDRLMGGGVVEGSLNLLGGEPGIGKSTMLLQLSKQLIVAISKRVAPRSAPKKGKTNLNSVIPSMDQALLHPV